MHNQLRLLLDMNHPQTRHFIAKGQRGAACGASAAPTGCASNG